MVQEVAAMKWTWMAPVAIAAAMTVGCNKDHNGSGTVGTSGRADTGVSSSDRNFVQDVSQMNAEEIDLSRLAVQHASSPDVKQFAQRLVDEHTAVGDKLSGVATQNGIETKSDLDDSHRKLHDTLAGKSGVDFDKSYIDAMVDDHEKMVDKLESRIDKTTIERGRDTVKNPSTDEKVKVDTKAQSVVPEKSDNEVTQRINVWAADVYPGTYAHLQSAKALKDTLKK
jgi:putative membrane protein